MSRVWRHKHRWLAGISLLVLAFSFLSLLPQAHASSDTRTKVGSFTVPATTGNHAVTGVGFQPKALLFFSVRRAQDGASSHSQKNLDMTTTILGMATSSTSQGAIYSTDDFSCGNPSYTNNDVLLSRACDDNNNTLFYQADLVSMDADGFTLNFSDASPTPYVVNYMAIGGDGISANITSFATPATVGDQSHTGVGFRPDSLILIGGSSTAQSRGIGFVSSPQNQVSNSSTYGCCGNAATARYQRTDKAYVEIDGTNKLNEATLTSFDSDGFTLNFSATNTGASTISALSLRGAQVHAGSFLQKTSTGQQTITGLGFKPIGLLTSSVANATSTTIDTNGIVQSIGAADGKNQANILITDRSNGNASLDRKKIYTSIADDATPTVQASASLRSFDSDGFTLNYTTADTTPREIIYLAIGPPRVVLQSGFPVTNFTGGSRTTITQPVTVQAGSDSILVVRSSHEDASDSGGITSITFNGKPLTKLTSVHATTWSRAEIWYLLSPDVTTADLIASKGTTGINQWGISVDIYDNVNQANPWSEDIVATAADSGISVSRTVDGFAPGDRTIDMLSLDNTGHNAVAGAHMINNFGTYNIGFQANEAQAADNVTNGTMSWTWSLDYPYSYIAAILKANTNPPPDPPQAPALTSPASGSVHNTIPISISISDLPLEGSQKLTFTGDTTVTLSLKDLEAGSHSFSISPLSPLNTQEVASASASSIPDGKYTVTFSMRDLADTTTLSDESTHVTIDSTAPSAPANLHHTTPVTNSQPTWHWTSSTDVTSGISHYIFQLSRESTFAYDVLTYTNYSTSLQLPVSLSPGTWYYRARAVDNAGNTSLYSPTASVHITETQGSLQPIPPTQNTPSPSQTNKKLPPPTSPAKTPESGASQPKILLDSNEAFRSGLRHKVSVGVNEPVFFLHKNLEYSVHLTQIHSNSAVVIFSDSSQKYSIDINQTIRHDIDNDGTPDIAVTLHEIRDGGAVLGFSKLATTASTSSDPETKDTHSSPTTWLIFAVATITASSLLHLVRKKVRTKRGRR